jgi:DNA-binding NtrC family response regulator
MRSIFHKINKVAETDVNVLITGENGTGKELVARALHRASSRAEGVFISVDMGALAENIFESELFGYEKGAFTDAKKDRHGRFELASEGTLFLDEISNISLSNQAKLLRVLEERQVVRLGSSKPIPFDIRLISATNASLNNLVSEGTFRQDLLYRVNTVEINLPPLREREKDIALLIEHFTNKFAKKYRKQPLRISSNGMKQLLSHSWPGNIRELKHTIERLVIMSDGSELDMNEFFSQTLVNELKFDSYNLEYIEKMVIEKVLKRYGGNISHSASELGITRAALYRRMSKYGL